MPYADAENRAKYQRELRAWRKAHHICIRCGKRDAVPHMSHCEECLYKNVMRYDPSKREQEAARGRKRQQEHREAGLCIYCSRPARPGKRTCSECGIRNAAANKENRRRKKAEKPPRDPSLCRILKCNQPRVKDRCYCAEHLKQYQEYVKVPQAAASNKGHIWRKQNIFRS